MDLQTILIIVLFVAALGYLVWRGYRSLAAKQTGCGKGCGCETNTDKSKKATVYR